QKVERIRLKRLRPREGTSSHFDQKHRSVDNNDDPQSALIVRRQTLKSCSVVAAIDAHIWGYPLCSVYRCLLRRYTITRSYWCHAHVSCVAGHVRFTPEALCTWRLRYFSGCICHRRSARRQG